MSRPGIFTLSAVLVLSLGASASAQTNLSASLSQITGTSNADPETDRGRDGLFGPVWKIRTETARLSNSGGNLLEAKRIVIEIAAYDLKGRKVENAYFPIGGATRTGQEAYKYDERGNICEMTLHDSGGALLAKESYSYLYDSAGNWTKMSTSAAVIVGGKLSFQPTEVTYRNIIYYPYETLSKVDKAVPAAVKSPIISDSKDNLEALPSPGAKTELTSHAGNQTQPLPVASLSSDKSDLATSVSGSRPANPEASQGNQPIVVMDAEPPAWPKPKLVKPVAGGLLNGSARRLPSPVYPDVAKRMQISGTVTVEVMIDESGKVIAAHSTSGNSILSEAAVKAAYRAQFSPTILSGQPLKVSGMINYVFSLRQ